MYKDRKTAVIICAGGIGKRMGAGKPKQFMELECGESILRHTVDIFRTGKAGDMTDILVVTAPSGFEEETERLVNSDTVSSDVANSDAVGSNTEISDAANNDSGNGDVVKNKAVDGDAANSVANIVTGGAERQDSVRAALEFLSSKGYEDDDIVLIHDGARPFVTEKVIMDVADAAYEHQAAIAAVPVKDTIRDLEKGTLDRSSLYSVQTPQGFRFGLIRDAVERASKEGFYGTDDGSLVERTGLMPEIVPGDYSNIKITTPEDLKASKDY